MFCPFWPLFWLSLCSFCWKFYTRIWQRNMRYQVSNGPKYLMDRLKIWTNMTYCKNVYTWYEVMFEIWTSLKQVRECSVWIWHVGESGNVLINEDADRVNSFDVWNYAEGNDTYYMSMRVDLTLPPDKVSDLPKSVEWKPSAELDMLRSLPTTGHWLTKFMKLIKGWTVAQTVI